MLGQLSEETELLLTDLSGQRSVTIFLADAGKTSILAIGGELKNTFCITSGNLFYLSPYVGDLEDLRTVRALEETVARMENLLEVSPSAIICDLHPKYNSTAVAEEMAARKGIPLYRIQHHYAHVLSCLAENDRTDRVIGVSFDGTGYGTDGTIWGGEILLADCHGFSRAAAIEPFLQIGGDSAPRQGWRIAASMIWSICKKQQDNPEAAADAYFRILDQLSICDSQNAKVQRMMAERKIQAVPSTSAGRLFDAVSAMLGICRESTYEGEASIELEFAAERYAQKAGCHGTGYCSQQNGSQELPLRYMATSRLFASLMSRRLLGEDPEKLAYDFHEGLADLIVEACIRISGETGIRTALGRVSPITIIQAAVPSAPIRICPSPPRFQKRMRKAGVRAREIHRSMATSFPRIQIRLVVPKAPANMVA